MEGLDRVLVALLRIGGRVENWVPAEEDEKAAVDIFGIREV